MKFHYWKCITHECGSFKFNNLNRHSMPWCEIQDGYSLLNDHNTWHNEKIGGLNGDVSRKFYPDWDRYCLELNQQKQRALGWAKQVEANEENVDYHREKLRRFMEKL